MAMQPRHVEAADHHREAVGAEPAGEIERARKLVRLHADQADHAGAGVTDAFGHAPRHRRQCCTRRKPRPRSRHRGRARAPAAHCSIRPWTLARLLEGNVEPQPLDDVAIRVVMRRLDQNDAKALGRACVHASSPKGTRHTRNPTAAPAALRRNQKGTKSRRRVGALCVFGGRFATVFGRNSPCRNGMWTEASFAVAERRLALEPAITATLRGENCRAEGKEGVVPAFTCALQLLRQDLETLILSENRFPLFGIMLRKRKDMERRQTLYPTCRAAGTAAPPAGGAHLSAFHRGSDLRAFARCARLQARFPGTWRERRSVTVPLPEAASGAVGAGVTRPRLSQSSGAPHGPVVVPAR